MADDDLVVVVDDHDRVIETVTRAEMRRRNLPHRCVYVLVRTSDDGIVVHRRADWKDVYPAAWDICFGGVLSAGEDWDAAARRELLEEAGIEGDVRPLGHGRWEGEGTAVVGRVYEVVHDGPYPCPDGEVVEVRVVPRCELESFLAAHDHCPDSAALCLGFLVEP